MAEARGLRAGRSFGHYYIVGPIMLLVFPLTIMTFAVFYFKQKNFFKILNLKVRKNISGFILFIFSYQLIMSPISLIGYIQELFSMKRVWK